MNVVITPPSARDDFVDVSQLEEGAASLINAAAFSGGWLICGGEGIGKATLAYRIARSLLWPDRSPAAKDLFVPRDSKTFALIASGAHPDLFVATRNYDEKKDRYANEISVDTIRNLTSFLNHTASMGAWRVAIVDTADELNRNAANALLKILEEPPAHSAILLLSSAPGKLLATIRSRCRRIDLRPLPDDRVVEFLMRQGVDRRLAILLSREARGRPGYALSLAASEGASAIEAADLLLQLAGGADSAKSAQSAVLAKSAAANWPMFRDAVVNRLSAEVRRRAAENGDVNRLIDVRENIIRHFQVGDLLNLDRGQVLWAIERELSNTPFDKAQ